MKDYIMKSDTMDVLETVICKLDRLYDEFHSMEIDLCCLVGDENSEQDIKRKELDSYYGRITILCDSFKNYTNDISRVIEETYMHTRNNEDLEKMFRLVEFYKSL